MKSLEYGDTTLVPVLAPTSHREKGPRNETQPTSALEEA